MKDNPVSVTTVGAVALWLAAVALAAGYATSEVRWTGIFAVLFAIGGATLTIRRFLIGLADDLTERERMAFELGRESQRIKPVH